MMHDQGIRQTIWRPDKEPFEQMRRLLEGIAQEIALSGRDPIPSHLMPTPSELRDLVQALRGASLMPDEGRYPCFSVLFSEPIDGAIQIERRPLTAEHLAKLAPVARGRSRIGVFRNEAGALEIWGLFPARSTRLQIRVLAPGRVVAILGGWNLAVFEGDQWISLDRVDPRNGARHGVGREHVATLLGQAFGTTLSRPRQALTGVLLLVVLDELQRQRHGGTIVILPADPVRRQQAEAWVSFGKNRLVPPIDAAAAFMKYLPRLEGEQEPMGRALELEGIRGYFGFHFEDLDPMLAAIGAPIGQLCGTDGAVVLTEELEIVAFGAMIRQPAGAEKRVDTICRMSMLSEAECQAIPISQLGGTRRQSAATFVANTSDTLALVASHDGPVTLAGWSYKGEHKPENLQAIVVTDIEMCLD
jgi:hypothetical protein